MNATIGQRIEMTRYISTAIDSSIGIVTGEEIVLGTVTEVSGGSAMVLLDHGDLQLIREDLDSVQGYPIRSLRVV
jgi:hypothetical protein